MTTRRSRGEGSLYWHKGRQRWIAEVTIGYDGRGKRQYKKGSGRTKTEAKARLRQILRDNEDGLAIAPDGYTVANAVSESLAFGVHRGGVGTRGNCATICRRHVLPQLGARKLRDLTADESTVGSPASCHA
jgi:hypothetical protein